MNQFMASGLIDKNWGVSSTASLKIGGASTLKLINSYRVWDNHQPDGDIIFQPISLVSRRSVFDSKNHNHELQFISPQREWLGGKFDMVAVVYYIDENFELGKLFDLGPNWCNKIVSLASRPTCTAYVASTGGRHPLGLPGGCLTFRRLTPEPAHSAPVPQKLRLAER